MCVRRTDSDTTNPPGQIFVQLLPPSVSECDSFYPCARMQIFAHCFMHELVNKRVTRSDWMSRLKCCVSCFFFFLVPPCSGYLTCVTNLARASQHFSVTQRLFSAGAAGTFLSRRRQMTVCVFNVNQHGLCSWVCARKEKHACIHSVCEFVTNAIPGRVSVSSRNEVHM